MRKKVAKGIKKHKISYEMKLVKRKSKVRWLVIERPTGSIITESEFEDEAEKDDHIIDERLIVHKMNELYLMGVEIDYDSEIFGSTFKFNNPRAKSQCGCGTSFSI